MGACGSRQKMQKCNIKQEKTSQVQDTSTYPISISKENGVKTEQTKTEDKNNPHIKVPINNQQDGAVLLGKLQSNVSDYYSDVLGGSRFGFSNELNLTLCQGIKYSQTASQSMRIQREITLLKNLPVTHTHSIFVKCNETATNQFSVLIVGAKDTPYSLGTFMFELYCSQDFPSKPPKMTLLTTGGSQVRFNPNLYNNGYICLSILGTWAGNPNEMWNESSSSILQILLSIQSLVMSDQVYYNEPGVGRQGQENNRRNQAYQNIVKISNIRHAMINMIKNPPQIFKDIIQTHFFLQQKQIIQQCNQWISEAKLNTSNNTLYDGLVLSQNQQLATRYQSNLSQYEKDLVKETQELKQLLEQLDGQKIRLCTEFISKQTQNQPSTVLSEQIVNNHNSENDTQSTNKQPHKISY